MHSAREIIYQLNLKPHPEGGFYCETGRSGRDVTDTTNHSVVRQSCAEIYYFLGAGSNYSSFHRIDSREIWAFHQGAPINIYIINQQGGLAVYDLGCLTEGHAPQITISEDQWFAAELQPNSKDAWSLVTCVTSPAFDFDHFKIADAAKLSMEFPQHKELIYKLSHQ